MNNELSINFTDKKVLQKAALLGILLIVGTFAPLINIQWITGPIVNATILIAAAVTGGVGAMLVGMVPSTIALAVGLLPSPLAPMVPFIIISNAILGVVFLAFYKKNYWASVIAAGAAKCLFLIAMSNVVVSLLLKKELTAAVMSVLSYSQFFTAIAGGVLAFAILFGIKKFSK